jgi:hypothetical protein
MREETVTRFQAPCLFLIRPDLGHSLLPAEVDPLAVPAFCTALASLSGLLSNCKVQADLDEAVSRGLNLRRVEIVPSEQFLAEVRDVLDEIIRRGEKAEAELN